MKANLLEDILQPYAL